MSSLIRAIRDNNCVHQCESCVTTIFSPCCVPISNVASRVYNFANENRGTFFLGASVAVALIVSPQVITLAAAMELFVGGVFTSVILQIIATLIGRNGFANPRSGEQLAALFGLGNLCLLYLNPMTGIAASVTGAGFGTTSLLIRQLTPPTVQENDHQHGHHGHRHDPDCPVHSGHGKGHRRHESDDESDAVEC
jgi:hypothetical protein